MDDSERNKSKIVEIKTPDGMTPDRLDRYLGASVEISLSRTKAQKLIADGLVLVDGRVVPAKHCLKGGEIIRLTIPEAPRPSLIGEDIPLDIVFEDDFLVVVDKPAGMVTHPAVGNYSGTLVNALIHHMGRLPQTGAADRPGIVHRLDKNTSGLLVAAKTGDVYLALQKAIQKQGVKRVYLALVCGHMVETEGLIDLPIGRSIKDRKRMTVTHRASRQARTEYRLIDRFRSYDLLEALLCTGRTHQIRVHFSHLGHPVFGDPEYGGREKWSRGMFGPERPLARKLLSAINRQALHARRLEFTHPVTGETLNFESELPRDFRQVLEILETEGS